MRLPLLPVVSWTEENVPQADDFGDVYFSRGGGLAESAHVFLNGCGLPDGWRDRCVFTIGELGFGSGLNALTTWRAWRRTRMPGRVLHFLTIENRPLALADAHRALAQFPEVTREAQALLAHWPERATGPQRLWFPQDGFCLTLFVGEAQDVLPTWRAPIDTWFLDGFAPSRNPAMWSPDIFSALQRLSRPGTRLATFSVAGHVRRGLEQSGFSVRKAEGFAGKRERLEARYEGAETRAGGPLPYAAHGRKAGSVAIIGAGLAGASLAHALGRRGVAATIFESAPASGLAASGNPLALVMPRLDRGEGPVAALHRAAFLYAAQFYESEGLFETRGVEQIFDDEERAAFEDWAQDPPWTEVVMRVAGPLRLMHARAGTVRPASVLATMLSACELRANVRVEALERNGVGWNLMGAGRAPLGVYSTVIIANGSRLANFPQTDWLPLEWSRGQIEWARGGSPPHAYAGDGYAAPFDGGVLFGASHEHVDQDCALTTQSASRAGNLLRLEKLLPDIAGMLDRDVVQSRVQLRTATPDRLPLAGLAPDATKWRAVFAESFAKGRAPPTTEAPAHDGLFVFGGLGSRGFAVAPLLAERLVSELCGEPAPIAGPMLDAVHPARYLIRAAKRGQSQ